MNKLDIPKAAISLIEEIGNWGMHIECRIKTPLAYSRQSIWYRGSYTGSPLRIELYRNRSWGLWVRPMHEKIVLFSLLTDADAAIAERHKYTKLGSGLWLYTWVGKYWD